MADGPTSDRWRRLHRLAGAVALTAFVVEHLLTNASALGGERLYDRVVGSILRTPIVLPLIELVFIVAPLGFHAGYGLFLLRRSPPDEDIDRFGDRRLWVMQRLSASLVLLFVLGHLWEFRVQRLFFGLEADALFTVLSAHLSWTWAGVPLIALLYLLGIAATAFHLANGLFAAAAPRVRPDARRRVRAGTVALGAFLFLVGATTVIGVATGTRLLPAGDADSAPCGPEAPSR